MIHELFTALDVPRVRDLDERVRWRIREGILPSTDPTRQWASRGSGLLCSVCDAPILETQVEYELDFDLTGSPGERRTTYLFHANCHQIWETARRCASR